MPRALPQWSSLRLRVVTPTVVGGAEPRVADPATPLRPASLRGLWRLWLRMGLAAVLGGGQADPAGRRAVLAGIARLEQHLFGETGSASRVAVQLASCTAPAPIPMPDKNRDPGLSYLGYGLFDKRPPVGLRVGAEAVLRVALRPRPGDDEAQTRWARQALWATIWLWANLGGSGARWRRGWGAMEILTVDGPPDLQATPKGRRLRFGERPTSPAEVARWLDEGIAAALWSFRQLAKALGVRVGATTEPPLPELRTLAGLSSIVVLPRPFRSASEALEFAGSCLWNYRSTLRRKARREQPLQDYVEVKGTLNGSQPRPRVVPRAAFGLPLPFQFPSLGGAKATVFPEPPRVLRYRGTVDRMPSALLFRVVPLQDGRVALALLDLEEGGTPLAGCTLRLQEIRRPPRDLAQAIPTPDRSAVAGFIDYTVQRARQESR